MQTNKIILVFLVMGLALPAFSQPPPDRPSFGGPFDYPWDNPRNERIRDRIQTVKIWKLTEELNLNQTQSERFFPVYNSFQSEREEIEERRRSVLKQLDELTRKENPSDSDINNLLDQFENIEKEMNTKQADFNNRLKDILTTRQIGRLLVFEMKFQYQIREIIRDARMEMRNKMRNRRYK